MNESLPDGPLESLSDNRAAADHLAGEVRRELLVFSRDMDPNVLNRGEWLEAVRQFVIRSRHTQLRVLVIDPTRAIREGHGLVRLGQRLSSHIHLHRVNEDHADRADCFIVADDLAYLYRPNAARWEGRWSTRSGADARQLRQDFDDMWQRSLPEPEFRKL